MRVARDLQLKHVSNAKQAHALIAALDAQVDGANSIGEVAVLVSRQKRILQSIQLAEGAMAGLSTRLAYYQAQLTLVITTAALVVAVLTLVPWRDHRDLPSNATSAPRESSTPMSPQDVNGRGPR